MSRAIRLVLRDTSRVYEFLEDQGPATAVVIAAALGLDRKRVYDHLDYMRAFFGEEAIASHDGQFSFASDAPRMPGIMREDRQVLAIANALLDVVGMPYGRRFERLFVKLAGGQEAHARLERATLATEVRRHLYFSEPVLYRAPAERELVTRLYELCTARPRRAVRFDYDSASNPGERQRRIWPLGLVFNHAWYLVGHDAKKDQPVRVYAADRIDRVRVEHLGPTLDLDDFDLTARMTHAWRLIIGDGEATRVVLRMPRSLARSRKHASQHVNDDGGAEVRVTYFVSEPSEMLGFILGHANSVEVLDPPALRELVVARLRQGLARHGIEVPK